MAKYWQMSWVFLGHSLIKGQKPKSREKVPGWCLGRVWKIRTPKWVQQKPEKKHRDFKKKNAEWERFSWESPTALLLIIHPETLVGHFFSRRRKHLVRKKGGKIFITPVKVKHFRSCGDHIHAITPQTSKQLRVLGFFRMPFVIVLPSSSNWTISSSNL